MIPCFLHASLGRLYSLPIQPSVLLGGHGPSRMPGTLKVDAPGEKSFTVGFDVNERPPSAYLFGRTPPQSGEKDPRSFVFNRFGIAMLFSTGAMLLTFYIRQYRDLDTWAEEETVYQEWVKERNRLGMTVPDPAVQDQYVWAEMEYHYQLLNRPGKSPRHIQTVPRPDKTSWSPQITQEVFDQFLSDTGIAQFLKPDIDSTNKAVDLLKQRRAELRLQDPLEKVSTAM